MRIDDEKKKNTYVDTFGVYSIAVRLWETFLSRLFKSEHEEYAEILTAFLAAANQNDTKENRRIICS